MSIRLKGSSGGMLKTRLASIAATVTLSGAAVLVPFVAIADHSTAHTIEQLTAQINALQAQLASLAGVAAPAAAPAAAGKCTFTRNLFQGVRGDDVKCLQDSLTSAGHYSYSGGSTGYFGAITKSAVAAWQAANGVAPAAGYFGSISRAKYDSMMMAAAPAAPGTPAAPAAPGTPAAPAAPAVGGSGLTVSAPADQPAATLAPQSAARLPFVRGIFTASADGDITVKSVTIERQGLADDSAFSDLVLLDENGMQVGLAKTLNASHRAILSESFVVKAGTSKTITISANMDSDLGGEAGQVAKVAIVAVDAGTATVNGAFPIVGNGMTINSTLAIGTVASPARGVLDPGAARSALEVGSLAFYASGVRWSVGSAEPVVVERMRWYQSGSAAGVDIQNVKVNLKGVDYDATPSSDGKYYDVQFGTGIEFDKGSTLDIGIKTDVLSGSARTIDFDLQRRTDLVARGKTFGYYITPANGTSDPTDDTGAFSNVEPYYDAYQHTISGGTLRVERSGAVAAGSVGVDVTNTSLGAFTFDAKGEPIQLTRVILNFTFTGTGTSSDVVGVALYDANGNVVAGPRDPSSGNVTFTDTVVVPVGKSVYTVKGKLDTTFVTNDTVVVSTQPRNMTARGQVTGLTVTADPNSLISASTQTVRAAALAVNVGAEPAAQNVVRGINGFAFAKYRFDATASGEDMRVTSATFRDTLSATGVGDEINSCQVFDGAAALNTGSNVLSPSDPSSGTTNDLAFTFDNHLLVPKGTTKLIELKCNISPSAANASTHAIGLVATDGNVVSVGKDTGTAVTETLTAATGQIMTVRTSGTLTVSLHDSSPLVERYGVAGRTNALLSVLKFRADYEPIKLTRLSLALSSSTASTSDLMDEKVTLWDGITQVGEAAFDRVNSLATSTLSSDFIIPKDGEKELTVKGNLGTLGLTGAGVRGRLIAVNYDGVGTTTTRGTGQSSFVTINPATGANTGGAGVRLIKSYPTFERLAVSSNTLPTSGEIALFRFKVTADGAGPVGLYKFSFRVSSTTVATTSAFRLFAFSDSAFAAPAYQTNPVNANDVDCVGSSSLETAANDSCVTDDVATTPLNRTASTSEIVLYFDPATNAASTPNAEAITVPKGESRYFELRGTISRGTAGDAISVALLGDNAVANNTNTVNREIADTVENAGRDADNFMWSPYTTTTSATTSDDWLNGFVVPGLPSTEMSAQLFSR